MINIPNHLSEITRDWVAACLEKKSLVSVTLEPFGEGVGMMSSMAIVRLSWPDNSSAELPDSLVIKIAAENDTNRTVAQQFNLYLKEVNYYSDLAPLTTATSPKVYASAIDDKHNFFLLMQDISDYRMGSQVDGATLAECELMVDFLARLHASFWNKLEDVAWLPHMSGSQNATNMAVGCEHGWEQLLSYFGEFVPEPINANRDLYIKSISSLQERLDQSPRTLIHGDFRMDNMLFGQKPGHEALMVVDFQGPLKGNGIQDLGYLLSHSAKTEIRQQHERELIARYVDQLGLHGVKHYTVDTAFEHYRVGVAYAWTVAVVIAGTMDPANDRGYAWMSKMVERNGIAFQDLNCLELLSS